MSLRSGVALNCIVNLTFSGRREIRTRTANGSRCHSTGSLEKPIISQHVTDVLEGTRWAFGVRRDKYEVGKSGA